MCWYGRHYNIPGVRQERRGVRDKPTFRFTIKEQLGGQVNVFCPFRARNGKRQVRTRMPQMKDLLGGFIVVDLPNLKSHVRRGTGSIVGEVSPMAEAIATASLQHSFLGVNVAK